MKSPKKNLPKGWRWASLGEQKLVTLIMGQSPPGETYNKDKIGLPFFQGCADFGILYPKPSVWCSKPKRIAEPNDILLSVRAPVGPTNIAKEICCIGRGLAAIRCREGLSYKYLIWLLRKFEKQIGGSGSIFNAIGKDEVKAIEFPLPPTIEDQIAIANQLERKMAEVNKMRDAALLQQEAVVAMQGAILREAFRYKEGETLPKGWICGNLKSITQNIQYGLSISSTKEPIGPRLLRITDIQNGYVDWSNVPYCKCSTAEAKKYQLEDDDLVFVRTGATTGKSYLISNPDNAVFASYLIRLQCKKEMVSPYYLYLFFQSPTYWQLITKSARGGTLSGFNATMLSHMRIPLPSTIDEQNSIANELGKNITESEKMRRAANKQLETVEALSGAILREAFDFM